MNNKIWTLGILLVAIVGCNVGNAPEPMNEDQLKTAVEKMPPQDQIDYINSSPMPPEMKAKRIKEIEDKTGYKAKAPSGPPQTGR